MTREQRQARRAEELRKAERFSKIMIALVISSPIPFLGFIYLVGGAETLQAVASCMLALMLSGSVIGIVAYKLTHKREARPAARKPRRQPAEAYTGLPINADALDTTGEWF